MVRPTTPPTTPPAIAPVLLDFLAVLEVLGSDVPVVVFVELLPPISGERVELTTAQSKSSALPVGPPRLVRVTVCSPSVRLVARKTAKALARMNA